MPKKKSDLERHIEEFKNDYPDLAEDFESEYRDFEIGVILRQAREDAGMTQEDLANRIHTQKTNISRLERHAEDVKLSTLRRVARALGKRVELKLI
jgi:ribosome-binding protein aMBF1 (putative translation factor)